MKIIVISSLSAVVVTWNSDEKCEALLVFLIIPTGGGSPKTFGGRTESRFLTTCGMLQEPNIESQTSLSLTFHFILRLKSTLVRLPRAA